MSGDNAFFINPLKHDEHCSKMVKYSQCISAATYEDKSAGLSKNAEWHLNVPFDLPLDKYLELKCERKDPGLKRIIPVILGSKDVLIYHPCRANVITASMRDCIAVPEPDPGMLLKFDAWVSRIFEDEIIPLLEDFKYSYAGWFNHLDSKQQQRQLAVDKQKLTKRLYCNFCKAECQIIDDESKNPKNRCICAPNEEYKYVVGPVVHMLEWIFKHNFKGYCSGKNWEEKEKMYNEREVRNLLIAVEGDASGYDRTQDLELKKCVEFRVYKWLYDHNKITHVDPEIFLAQATQELVKVRARVAEGKGKFSAFKDEGFFTKKGCTQTGNMDTTFANTLRMCLYNRFIIELMSDVLKENYELDAAGDDFGSFLNASEDIEKIRENFYKVFTKEKVGIHGLGQILKFFKVSNIKDIDFCSTELFKDKFQGFKIIRQIERFMTTTPWSRKALGMNNAEQKHYMLDLYEANKSWIGDLPLLSEYNELLNVFANKLSVDPKMELRYQIMKRRAGIQKGNMPIEPDLQQLYEKIYNPKEKEFVRKFGRDAAYGMLQRNSTKIGCGESFLDMLNDRYGLSRPQVKQMQEQLIKAQKLNVTDDIDLIGFREMCEVKISRQEYLMQAQTFNPD
jgi:hypothetical protein